MVAKKVFAISINIFIRGSMIARTSGLAEATSVVTLRGRLGGNSPSSSSILLIICSYTCLHEEKKIWLVTQETNKQLGNGILIQTLSGLISKLRSLCSIKL